jgi:hypothetical protein
VCTRIRELVAASDVGVPNTHLLVVAINLHLHRIPFGFHYYGVFLLLASNSVRDASVV